MLYKRPTAICDDDYDWGHFIDMDDMPINQSSQVCHKITESHYTKTTTYQWLRETSLIALEIPIIKDSCICSTLVTTLTVGSLMVCFIF
jgi:hypothetical protein